jgi:hypothetical protein
LEWRLLKNYRFDENLTYESYSFGSLAEIKEFLKYEEELTHFLWTRSTKTILNDGSCINQIFKLYKDLSLSSPGYITKTLRDSDEKSDNLPEILHFLLLDNLKHNFEKITNLDVDMLRSYISNTICFICDD